MTDQDQILNLTENACAALVRQTAISQSLPLDTDYVYTFLGNSSKEPLTQDGKAAPYVTCQAETAERAVPNTRIDWWKVKTNIVVVQPMYDSDYASRGLIADTIFNAIINDSGSVNLTNALSSSFSCGATLNDETYTSAVVDDEWVQMLSVTLLASPNK